MATESVSSGDKTQGCESKKTKKKRKPAKKISDGGPRTSEVEATQESKELADEDATVGPLSARGSSLKVTGTTSNELLPTTVKRQTEYSPAVTGNR